MNIDISNNANSIKAIYLIKAIFHLIYIPPSATIRYVYIQAAYKGSLSKESRLNKANSWMEGRYEVSD